MRKAKSLSRVNCCNAALADKYKSSQSVYRSPSRYAPRWRENTHSPLIRPPNDKINLINAHFAFDDKIHGIGQIAFSKNHRVRRQLPLDHVRFNHCIEAMASAWVCSARVSASPPFPRPNGSWSGAPAKFAPTNKNRQNRNQRDHMLSKNNPKSAHPQSQRRTQQGNAPQTWK